MPEPTTMPRLYDDLARLWPHLSPPEHYAPEADAVHGLLRQHLGEPPADRKWRILELGAGGGHTLYHLTAHYDCTASDLSQPMLDNCKALNPEVRCVQGDMRTLRLGETFDAVLIHDAIDYMLSEDDVLATLRTTAQHLRPGGVALIAPTYVRETFVDGDVADDGTTIPGIGDPRGEAGEGAGADHDELTYFTFVHDADPEDSVFEMILLYLIRDGRTRRVEVVEDRHTCGLFAAEHWLAMMDAAGLTPQPVALPEPGEGDDEPAAWTLFVGRRGGGERG
ncbi:MAG: class I SAM-dependent methyltransferase [Phycisphaerales bacterium JB063]